MQSNGDLQKVIQGHQRSKIDILVKIRLRQEFDVQIVAGVAGAHLGWVGGQTSPPHVLLIQNASIFLYLISLL